MSKVSVHRLDDDVGLEDVPEASTLFDHAPKEMNPFMHPTPHMTQVEVYFTDPPHKQSSARTTMYHGRPSRRTMQDVSLP